MSMPYDKIMNPEYTDDFIRFTQFNTQKTGANSRVPPICSASGQFPPSPRNAERKENIELYVQDHHTVPKPTHQGHNADGKFEYSRSGYRSYPWKPQPDYPGVHKPGFVPN